MNFDLTNISIILFITTLVNLFTVSVAWKRRKTKGGIYFCLAMVGITIWTLASAFDYAATAIPLKVVWAKIETIAYSGAITSFAMYSLSYAGYEDWLRKKWVRRSFILFPFLSSILAWTNGLHHWWWTGFSASEFGFNLVVFHHGPAFYIAAIIGYLLVLSIIVNLWLMTRKGSDISRRQAWVLLGASVIPVVSNILYLLDIPGYAGIDWSSLTFSLSGLLFLWALYGTRFMDIVPIARRTIFQQLSDAVLVFDTDIRVLDFNVAAGKLFGLDNSDLGEKIQSIFSKWPKFLEFFSGQISPIASKKVICEHQPIVFELKLSLLEDDRGQLYGYLIILRDITQQHEMEEALRASQDRYRTVADYTYDWEYWLNPEGVILYMSPSCERISGYTPAEFIQNPNLIEAIVYPEDRNVETHHRNMAFQQNHSKGLHQVEFRILNYDGSIHWIFHTCQNIYNQQGHHLGIRATNRDITRQKQTEMELQSVEDQLLEQQRQLARNDERQSMARDLHDSVNQSIHSMVLFSETLAATLEKGNVDRAIEIMGRLQESARQSLKETRLMLYQLQNEEPDRVIDLLEGIEARLATVERRAGIRTQLTQEGDMDDFPAEWHENVFYIVIEALNNALKHAQTRGVQVLVRSFPTNIEIKVIDDGIGFDPQKIPTGGMGMNSMQTRAKELGGAIEITSQVGQGTTVRFVAQMEMKE